MAPFPVFVEQRDQITKLAMKHRLPSLPFREHGGGRLEVHYNSQQMAARGDLCGQDSRAPNQATCRLSSPRSLIAHQPQDREVGTEVPASPCSR
jgi:hypothetical protein